MAAAAAVAVENRRRWEGREGSLSSRQRCNNEPASAIFKTYHQYTTGSSRF